MKPSIEDVLTAFSRVAPKSAHNKAVAHQLHEMGFSPSESVAGINAAISAGALSHDSVCMLTICEQPLLPPVRSDLRDFEKPAAFSEDVLVLLRNTNAPIIGRYVHGLGEWQIPGRSGTPPNVVEWWPLPTIGTGIKINE